MGLSPRPLILYPRPMSPLVSTAWLAEHLGAPDLRILDCTYLDPALGRDARAEHEAAHIPGAVFLDLKAVSDPDTDLPTMLPTGDHFARVVGALGVGTGNRVVLYDASPWRTAARAWFTFRSFGLAASILDGGLDRWRAEGRAVESGRVEPRPATLTVPSSRIAVRDLAAVRANLDARAEQMVDARSATRFSGEEADPRPGVAPGHIPGSVNLPYTKMFAADGTYKPLPELAQVFADAGIDLDRPLLATCGSGVTASTVAFAAHLLGREVPVYDGSWTEWGADPSTPKVTA